MDRIKRILPALRKSVYPEGEKKERLIEKFKSISKENDYISNEEYAKQISEDFKDQMIPQALKDALIKRHTNLVTSKDSNQDGKVTLTEYLNGECYMQLGNILSGEGDNYDGKMSKNDIIAFLKNWCESDIDKDADAFTTVFQPEERKGEELLTEDVIDGFYKLMCPDASERVNKVVKRVRKVFGLNSRRREDQEAKFDEIAKGRECITKADHQAYVSERLKCLHLDRSERRKIRGLASNWMKVLHQYDRNQDGRITRSEFLNLPSYMNMMRSFEQYDRDGDMIIDLQELTAWLSEKLLLFEDTQDYADAVTHEFMGDGGKVLRAIDLLNGLFNRAFPNDATRITQIIELVEKKFALSGEAKEAAQKEFKELAGDNDFLTMEKYKEISRRHLEEELAGMPITLRDSCIENALEERINSMQSKDRSKDGLISESEYLHDVIGGNLTDSLMGDADGEDGKMDKREMTAWLSKVLGITEDVDLYTSAIYVDLKAEGETTHLDTWTLANRLFEEAFPPDAVLVRKVVQGIREEFLLSTKEEDELLEKFKMLAGKGKTTVPIDVLKNHVKNDLKADYQDPKMVDAILPQRLEAIDRTDNGDGLVSYEEFVRGELYGKIYQTLHAHNTDGDMTMSRDEVIQWLREHCSMTNEAFADALIGTFLDGVSSTELPIDGLMTQLFDLAFPSTETRVKSVVDAIKEKFWIRKPDMIKSLQAGLFDKKRCSEEEFAQWLRKECNMVDDVEENAAAAYKSANSSNPTDIINALIKA